MTDTITIQKSEYKALLEAKELLEDMEAYDKSKQLNEESVPSEFVEKMLEGESPLKLWRGHRGHTQQALSDLSGVNRVQIADIEAKRKTGSVATLKKLADALNLAVDDLI